MNDDLNNQLIESCKSGNLSQLAAVVKAGAQMDIPNIDGPMFWAAYHGNVDCLAWMLDNGASLDFPNSKGSTPLMAAAEQGKLEAVRFLLLAGADRDLKNNDNRGAKDYASIHNHAAVIDLLDKNPDEVTYSYKLNNRTLQEVFNFERRERVTLVRNGAEGPVEAVMRDSFEELADQTALRKAFTAYKALGGKREECEVFQNALPKPKPKLVHREM